MSTDPQDVAADVHALIQDLLPVLVPDARFNADAAEVVLPVGRAEPRAGTTLIVERCARTPQHQWPKLVQEWLLGVSDRATLAIGEIELLGDVRELLRLRIVPRVPDAERDTFVLTELGRHLDAMVVIDHPRYGGPLTKERCARLGLSRVGSLAVNNTREHELAGVAATERPITMTESVRVVTEPGNRYVSAVLTELPRHLPETCPYGALVGVPDHSTVLLYPVTSTAVLDVLPVFADVVAEMWERGDDACSRDTFWWRDDRLSPVPARGALPAGLAGLMPRIPPKHPA